MTVPWLQQVSTEESTQFFRGRVGMGVDIQPDMGGDSEFGRVVRTMLMSHIGTGQVVL